MGVDGANPYRPPQASIADGGGRDPAVDGDDAEPELPPWRLEGLTLFVRHGTTLPDICLFTGEPTKPTQRMRFPLSWTPLWFKLFAVPYPMLAAMTYSSFHRSSSIELGLGPAGHRRHRFGLLLCLAAMIDGLALVTSPGWEPALAGLLFLTLLALIFSALALRVFQVDKIDRRYARLRLRPRVAAAFARLPAPPPR